MFEAEKDERIREAVNVLESGYEQSPRAGLSL